LYLTRERQWEREQLEQATPEGDQTEGPIFGEEVTQEISLSQVDQPLPSIESQTVKPLNGHRDAALESIPSVSEAAHKRRVTVHSPAGKIMSPSLPPSVAQEQLRRREAIQPRSILKLSMTACQDPAQLQKHAASVNLDQTRVEERLTSKDNDTTASRAANAVVEKIRAELIPDETSRLAWSLPSVADYERGGQFSLDDARILEEKTKRRHENMDHAMDADTKRRRTIAQNPSFEDRQLEDQISESDAAFE
jgi:hypothetical protein